MKQKELKETSYVKQLKERASHTFLLSTYWMGACTQWRYNALTSPSSHPVTTQMHPSSAKANQAWRSENRDVIECASPLPYHSNAYAESRSLNLEAGRSIREASKPNPNPRFAENRRGNGGLIKLFSPILFAAQLGRKHFDIPSQLDHGERMLQSF